MQNVHKLDAKYAEVMREIEDGGGVLTPELEEEFDAVEADRTVYLETCGFIHKNFLASAAAIRLTVQEMAERARGLEGQADSWKRRADKKMIEWGIDKAVGRLLTLRRQANPPVLIVEDEQGLPDKYAHMAITLTLEEAAAMLTPEVYARGDISYDRRAVLKAISDKAKRMSEERTEASKAAGGKKVVVKPSDLESGAVVDGCVAKQEKSLRILFGGQGD